MGTVRADAEQRNRRLDPSRRVLVAGTSAAMSGKMRDHKSRILLCSGGRRRSDLPDRHDRWPRDAYVACQTR